MRTAALLALVALTGAVVRADILHLRDGTRHTGTLVSHTKDEIVFRVRIDAGGSTVVRRYALAHVARIDRDTGEPIVFPPGAPAEPDDPEEDAAARQLDTAPGANHAASAPAPNDDAWESVVQAAFDALRRDDAARALPHLQRIALRAPAETRTHVDERLKRERAADLATTLADVRIRAALARGRGRSLRIDFATELEKPVLARLLEQCSEEWLGRAFAGHPLRAWANDPGAYERLAPDAQGMVGAARVAGGLLHARLRFDPRLRDNRAERLRLRQLADALARFAAEVARMPGYTALHEPAAPPPVSTPRPRHSATTAPVATPAASPAARPPDDE